MRKPVSLDIDVGTGSAGAGLFDNFGGAPGAGAVELGTFRPGEEYSEQSPENIWRSVFDATKLAMRDAGPEPSQYRALTCSISPSPKSLLIHTAVV